jgi:uncharacterized membrane protein YfcA
LESTLIPEDALVIAFFFFGVLLLGFGIWILIRRRVTVQLRKDEGINRPAIILKMTGGRALLSGAAVTVLGLKILITFAMTWVEGGDLKEIPVSGNVMIWAIVALVVAVVWHISLKAKSLFTSPELKKKVSDKIQQAMDEQDKDR